MASPRDDDRDAKRLKRSSSQEMNLENLRTQEIESWKAQEDAADTMIPQIGKLYRQDNIIVTLFGTSLVFKNCIEIVSLCNDVNTNMRVVIRPSMLLNILSEVSSIVKMHQPNLKAMRVDLGRISILIEEKGVTDIKSFLLDQLQENHLLAGRISMTKARDVILYGFGRIGRLLARLLIQKTGAGVKLLLRAIVVRQSGGSDDLEKRASLLSKDSVHGKFQGSIKVNRQANAIVANGNVIQVIYSDGPDKCDYTKYGIHDAIVIDNTGKWRDSKSLALHLKSPGTAKVILTAPPKDGITTIIAGVNEDRIDDSLNLYSAASCTTNAIVPCLAALQRYDIERVHIETVHSFTNDQNLIDNMHPKERRGRSAVLNMVLTETGAAEAVGNCLPALLGKITANAIRVPTPNVSLAILTVDVAKKDTAFTKETVNNYLSNMSLSSHLKHQIEFVSSSEAASSDFVGSTAAAIVDGEATIVKNNRIHLYIWYDNEYGYSCQVIRLLQRISKIDHIQFP